MTTYIYLIQEKKFINTQIYKLGKTTQLNQFPIDSELLICIKCSQNESQLIQLFYDKYEHKKCYGNGYFDGEVKEMIKDIVNITNNIQKTQHDIDIDDISNKIKTIHINGCLIKKIQKYRYRTKKKI